MGKIRVIVAGAKGRMGQEVIKMVTNDEELEFVGGVDLLSSEESTPPIYQSLEKAIIEQKPDVLVDFTIPQSVRRNMEVAMQMGVSPVVGTTGLTQQDIEELDKLAKDYEIGGLIAPNFSIGAVLMMKFSAIAARYMPHVEIIEMHHDKKLDAPSGTAIKTAELMEKERKLFKQGHPDEEEIIPGARGGEYSGFRIHSVRLPGYVAHQEVIFSDVGQTLSVRHDSMNRESFMPGVNLAIKKVKSFEGIVYGLEHFIE